MLSCGVARLGRVWPLATTYRIAVAFSRGSANRQRIANLFPPADRLVLVAPDRQRVASIGGGATCCSRHLGARSLPFPRCLCRRFGAGDLCGKPHKWAGKHTLHRPTTTSSGETLAATTAHRSPVTLPSGGAGRNCHESASNVAAPANIQGGDAVAGPPRHFFLSF